jgi:putative hydrolase of the HAD superfamily
VLTRADNVESIVFDLDGTLYTNSQILNEITTVAEQLVARSRGLSPRKARDLILTAKNRLAEDLEREPTLTRTCVELGIDVRELHQAFQDFIRPERYLVYDPVLQALLDSLTDHCNLYIYTNNNLPLTCKILALLGVEDLFEKLYTIEFRWIPKPDPETLQLLLEDIGGPPESFLFIGDRHQVDLQPADELGIPTLLVGETSDLLQIHQLLGIIP